MVVYLMIDSTLRTPSSFLSDARLDGCFVVSFPSVGLLFFLGGLFSVLFIPFSFVACFRCPSEGGVLT